MNPVPSQRFRLMAILAPLIAVALGSFWLLEVMRRASSDQFPSPERKEPDFYVDNFSYVNLSKSTGNAQYQFAGEKLIHHPQDDSYEILQPVLHNLGNGRVPTTMRAERATVNSDNSEVRLYDNVRVDRPASGDKEAMHMRSEYLLVLPDDDVMKTPKPVEIVVGNTTLTGTGMFANNATREFSLSNSVHGTYQPPQR